MFATCPGLNTRIVIQSHIQCPWTTRAVLHYQSSIHVWYKRVQTIFYYKPWAHESHIKRKFKDYYIYMLSRSSTTISTYLRWRCLAQGHHHDRSDLLLSRIWISGVEVAEHHFRLTFKLGLESNLSTKVLARLTRLNKQGSCKGSSKSFKVK